MKKVYKKPEAFIESFTLCTNVAAGCEVKTDLLTENVLGCGYKYGRDEVVVFTDAMGCVLTEVEEDGSYNGVCYHTPSDANNLFNS